MKLSVSTLGCPAWSLDEVLQKIPAMGIHYVDFRGVGKDLDITLAEDFTVKLAETKKRMDNAGLYASGISSSIFICDPARFEANIEEAKRTIPLALALNAGGIRIFGGGKFEAKDRGEFAKAGHRCLYEILKLKDADKISWRFETHDEWVSINDCKMILNAFPEDNVGLIWDIEPTLYLGKGNEPADYCRAFGKRIVYTHIKDGYPPDAAGKIKTATPGTGDLKVRMIEAIKTLRDLNRYEGFLTLEFEKRWQPDIAEPEIAFPAFVNWMKSNGLV